MLRPRVLDPTALRPANLPAGPARPGSQLHSPVTLDVCSFLVIRAFFCTRRTNI